MITVGITGGIGSGKTTVCRIFETLHIPVYYADARAKELMNENPSLKLQLIQYFGNNIYQGNQINRPLLASKIFRDKKALTFVNNIVHPAVLNDFTEWIKKQPSKYVIEEAALLFESGSYKKLDLLITVTCPEELRIKRVMERDMISREEVLGRLHNQWPENKKAALSDIVIKNDGSTSLIEQVHTIHEKIIKSRIKNT